MQFVRVVFWVLILVGVIVFSIFNWNPVEVVIWENLVVETRVPALVVIAFLLGFLPVWLYARGVIWSLNRKIRSLEIAAKSSTASPAARDGERDGSLPPADATATSATTTPDDPAAPDGRLANENTVPATTIPGADAPYADEAPHDETTRGSPLAPDLGKRTGTP